MSITLDSLDQQAASAFEGYIVRKDLVRKYKGQYPIPTYVVEFLLGRYCSTVNEEEIADGLAIVERQLRERTVRAGEEELFKSRAERAGSLRIIDLISARLETKTNSYLAELPSLRLRDVRIAGELVEKHDRMLTGGFYAEIDLVYDPLIAEEQKGRPFGVQTIREIQISKRDTLDALIAGRKRFSVDEWKRFLLRSIGLEPESFSQRAQDMLLMRMIPFVERNYNLVELGPRGTGKSHLFQQVSPYAHLVSGGKATVARMFVNNQNGQRGLVCQYDVVCFDEVSGISFDQKDGVNILKGYMESGAFSRGKEMITAEGGVVMVGNFDVDVEHQQKIGHLLGPLPPEMRNDTAFMDRVHSYLAGWEIPKMHPGQFTNHFGLVSDFVSSCWRHLRNQSRLSSYQARIHFGGALSGRDLQATNKTVSGLLKLIYPDSTEPVPDDVLEWATHLALECRRRVKEQQKRIGPTEFRNTQFSYVLGTDGVEKFVATPELHSESAVGDDPLPPGQVWTISPGGMDEQAGLFRVEVTHGPGSDFRVLNRPVPPAFKESVELAKQNLYANARELVGDRDPRQHEFSIQLRAFDANKSGGQLSLGILLAASSALLGRNIKGGLVVVGGINLGGSVEPIYNAAAVAELAVEKGATSLLAPVAARRQLNDLSDDLITKITIQYYATAKEALLKALAD